MPATRKALWTSKKVPKPWCFNDFDARRRGANFSDCTFQKCPGPVSFYRFWFPNRSRAQAWCKFWRIELPKVPRTSQSLTILTSKSWSHAGVVQLLATATSKSDPAPSVFNDFHFQIALARRRGANFTTSSAADPPHPPVLRSLLSQPAKPQNYGKTQHFSQFLQYPPNPHVAHLCCITSLLSHICGVTSLGWQIFSSNSQYSRKLDS